MPQEDEPLQRFDTLPHYTTDRQAQTSTLKWSGPEPIPRIGADVRIKMNGIGLGRVISYAVYCGYLGLMVMPYAPPAWWTDHNGAPAPERAGLAFGSEIERVPAAEPVPARAGA
ncbi:MAG: hypothetical protein ACLGJD_10890 [Gammaproteobacteria bacterium]|uniref:hypothetical protein n=1 Tax=uncultured Pseudacidovorax sp. TaxID=679313 RepID=UPI0025CE6435|nr:hypothetical protein [uncultured Pseudacidovorax sp.]